ncbi:MAG TPA: hypothetical protein VNO31_09205 [Umezawaea sp.]|nr:hypothetical protein [Umezawaea sp.]
MTDEVEREKNVLREALRALRTSHGMSQTRLGATLGDNQACDRFAIARVERGEAVGLPGRVFWSAADRALGNTGTLVAQYDRVNFLIKQSWQAAADALTPTTLNLKAADPAGSRTGANRAADVQDRRVTVRSDALVQSETLTAAADESVDLLLWLERGAIGEHTVDQLHSDVRRICGNYLRVPTWQSLRRAIQLRDRAKSLLVLPSAPGRSRELYSAAGWSLIVLAWMNIDLGHFDLAGDHARAALVCAERADHNALRAWVRATQHTAAYWQHDYLTAADYAQQGLALQGIGTARLFLTGALAADLAHAGQHDRASEALTAAKLAADRVVPVADELAAPFSCSLDRARSVWSDAELALGDVADALDSADRAVAAFEATPVAQRNIGSERMARLLQATAHLQLGDPAAAHGALTPVLGTTVEHRLRPLMARLARIDAMASSVTKSSDPAIVRLRKDIAEFRRGVRKAGAPVLRGE